MKPVLAGPQSGLRSSFSSYALVHLDHEEQRHSSIWSSQRSVQRSNWSSIGLLGPPERTFPGIHEPRRCCQCKNKLHFIENHIRTDHTLHLACRTCRRSICCARQKQKKEKSNRQKKLYDTQFSMYQALTECRCCKGCSRCRGAADSPGILMFAITSDWLVIGTETTPKKLREECVSHLRLRVRGSGTDPRDQPAQHTLSMTLVTISNWRQLNDDSHWICWG